MEEEQRQNPVEETTSEPPASPLELLDETINVSLLYLAVRKCQSTVVY